VLIFQSGSLIANMLLGMVILNKSYDAWKYSSVGMITIGIILCTIASGSDQKRSDENRNNFFWWLLGILMLSSSLFITACLGLYQETLYKKRGKHVQEALFYTNILPMPAFLVIYKNIFQHLKIALESEILDLNFFSIRIQIFYVIANSLAHFLCITCVFILTTECTSLTVTLTVTLRKFSSLLLSIFYFNHKFTMKHWIGTIFIVIGTVIFTECIPKIFDLLKKKNEDKLHLMKQNLMIETQNSLKEIFVSKVPGTAKKIEKDQASPKIHNKSKIFNSQI
jgi:UDP-xylose/UDP-N-acetylglucosamine transporter B4